MNGKCEGQGGFSLVEVALALGVLGFCLIVLLGLLPVGIATNRESFEQTTAASIATLIITDLQATSPNSSTSATSPQFQISVPASGAAATSAIIFFRQDESTLPASTTSASAAQAPTYRATLTLTPPPSTGPRRATSVRIFITWPAMADPQASLSPSHYTGSFETMAALDRN